MYYSKWADKAEILKRCTVLKKKGQNDQAGIPVVYDKDKVYTLNPTYHNLVIGSEGSGKTQVTILPLIRMASLASNSIVINDTRGDLYKHISTELKDSGYDVIALDYQNNDKNHFNPLYIPYVLYKEGKDQALKMVEEVGYYLLNEGKIVGDPFWENTAIDYFVGLALYLFEQGDESKINISGVYELSNKISDDRKEFMKKIDKNSSMYAYLTATLMAPPETYGSILSVFHQKIRKYIVGVNLNEMLSNNDFNLLDIVNKKLAIFVIGGTSGYSDHLIPLVFSQAYSIKEINPDSKQFMNMIIADLDSLIPLKNIVKVLNYARSIGVNYTVTINNFASLIKLYGQESFEMMKLCFSNIIYLLSNDIGTLRDISNFCGQKDKDRQLISIDELKRLKQFEAIILSVRELPYRINLVPDYKIEW